MSIVSSFLSGLFEQSGVLRRFASSDIYDRNVMSLVFQYLGHLVAIASDMTLSLWVVHSHLKPVRVRDFRPPSTPIQFLKWSPCATMIAICQYKHIVIFNVAKSEPYWKFRPHSSQIISMTWSPKGRFLATCSMGHDIYLWHVKLQIKYQTISNYPRVTYSLIQSLSWSFGVFDSLAFIYGNTTIKLFSMSIESEPLTFKSNGTRIFEIGWSPCKKRLAFVCESGSVQILNGQTGNKIHHLKGHTASVFHLAWSLDGMILATVAINDEIFLWDTNTCQIIRKIDIPGSSCINKISFSPNGSMLSIAYNFVVVLYSIASRTFMHFPISKADKNCDIAYCPH